jgi:hypothetical protein
MKTLGKDGYVLNLQTMAYEKSPPPGPPTTAK